MLRYFVFGAHSRGQTTAVYLRKLHPDWEFKGYLYDDEDINSQDIDGFPVQKLIDTAFAENDRVYIGTRSIYHTQITEKLKGLGVNDIVPVDVSLDIDLRGAFVADYLRNSGRKFIRLEELLGGKRKGIKDNYTYLNCCVLVVKSTKDSPIRRDVELKPYEHYIQAGAAIDGRKLDEYDFYDDECDGISDLNRQFCELTALYWSWKNIKDDIIGIEHYRRRFILQECWTQAFDEKLVDAILPVPLYVRPSIEGNYLGRHNGESWNEMLNILHELDPKLESAARVFFGTTGCYSPCNMLIARKEVLNDLCSWLFPLLFEVRKRCGTYDDPYQNRYLGFLSERLITFFFYWKRDQYKVAYADKTFFE